MKNRNTTSNLILPGNFRLMVLGQIISVFGSALLRFALSLYILDVTGSESLFATLYAISSLPLLLAPLGGAVADRFNRRNLMVIFDFASSAVVLSLVVLMGIGRAPVWVIGSVMVILSAVSALYTPAVTASIPSLVESDKLEGANGIVQAVQALSGIAAPVLGGVLYGVFGVRVLISMSCAAFFLSAVMELFIHIPFVERPHQGSMAATIASDLRDGFAYVKNEPFILKSTLMATMLNLVLTPLFFVGVPIILRVTMNSGDALYGLSMGIVQLATIVGALSVGIFAKKMQMNTVYRWSLATSALLIPMALSITPFMLRRGHYSPLILFMMCAVPIAAAVTIMSIFVITKVQKKTPCEHLGKVMAIIMAVAQCAAPLGQMIYGITFEAFSDTLYLPVFAVSLMMLGITAVSRQMMKNEREPELI